MASGRDAEGSSTRLFEDPDVAVTNEGKAQRQGRHLRADWDRAKASGRHEGDNSERGKHRESYSWHCQWNARRGYLVTDLVRCTTRSQMSPIACRRDAWSRQQPGPGKRHPVPHSSPGRIQFDPV